MLATLVLVARAGTTATDAATRPVVLAGAAATLLQTLSLLRWPRLGGPAAAVLGGLALVTLLPAANRALATEMAVLFLTSTELAGWGAGLRSVIPETSASIGRQLGQVGAVVAVGGITTATIARSAGTGGVGPDGRAALVIGLVAAVVPLALLASRRWREASEVPVGRDQPSGAGSASPADVASSQLA
jgi:hypothetical protein